MNSCHIRQATLSDIPEMHGLISVAMAQYAKDSAIPTPLDALLETEEDLKAHVLQDYFLLAFRSGKLAGTLRISKFDEHPRNAESNGISGNDRGVGSNEESGSNRDPHSAERVNPKIAYISRFAVHPSLQKLGVGNVLFTQAEEYMETCGYQSVVLHTALTNAPLVRFYMKRKFKLIETKTDRGYPRGTFVRNFSVDPKRNLL